MDRFGVSGDEGLWREAERAAYPVKIRPELAAIVNRDLDGLGGLRWGLGHIGQAGEPGLYFCCPVRPEADRDTLHAGDHILGQAGGAKRSGKRAGMRR